MGRPGNKRLQRAMYGASPSSDGSLSTNMIGGGRGRANVQRTVGSVINNGGNMMMGTYPTVGVGLPFLLKLSGCCKPDASVQTNNVPMNDISSTLSRDIQYRRALRYISANTAANTAAIAVTALAATDVTTAQTKLAGTLPATTAPELAANKAAEDAVDAAIANYNAKKAISDTLTAKLNASTAFKNAYDQTEADRLTLITTINNYITANPRATAADIAADAGVISAQNTLTASENTEQPLLVAFVAIME